MVRGASRKDDEGDSIFHALCHRFGCLSDYQVVVGRLQDFMNTVICNAICIALKTRTVREAVLAT